MDIDKLLIRLASASRGLGLETNSTMHPSSCAVMSQTQALCMHSKHSITSPTSAIQCGKYPSTPALTASLKFSFVSFCFETAFLYVVLLSQSLLCRPGWLTEIHLPQSSQSWD